MIRDKKANARRDTLEAPDANLDANRPDKKHHAFHTRPVNRVRIAGDQSIDQQRRPDEQDVQRQEDANEKSPEHGRQNFLESHAAGQTERGIDRIINERRRRWSRREASPLESGAPFHRRANPRWLRKEFR
jgi:hypothetical protein